MLINFIDKLGFKYIITVKNCVYILVIILILTGIIFKKMLKEKQEFLSYKDKVVAKQRDIEHLKLTFNKINSVIKSKQRFYSFIVKKRIYNIFRVYEEFYEKISKFSDSLHFKIRFGLIGSGSSIHSYIKFHKALGYPTMVKSLDFFIKVNLGSDYNKFIKNFLIFIEYFYNFIDVYSIDINNITIKNRNSCLLEFSVYSL